MSEERCGAIGPLTTTGLNEICTNPPGHIEDHWNVRTTVSWPKEPVRKPLLDSTIPDSVRTRVDLHRAQAAYDLTVLRARLNTITVNTAGSKRLRARREQLTAELDAWSYLARITRQPR